MIEVYAYAADGRAELTETSAGTRIARLSADCGSNPALTTPIDVTALVRQVSVHTGVRQQDFNIRKANNRQGLGLFNLAAGRLTVGLAEDAVVLGAGWKTAREQARAEANEAVGTSPAGRAGGTVNQP